jgi:inner membrane protein
MTEKSRKWKVGADKVQLLRILGIMFLVFLLQIPILQIDSLIDERRTTRYDAVSEVTEKWGKWQTLQGPLIVVPFEEITETYEGSSRTYISKTSYATFLPEQLDVNVKIDSEIRYRSIYDIPLYRAHIDLKGDFEKEKMTLIAGGVDLQWDKARLVIATADPKSVQKDSFLKINDRNVVLEPGVGAGLKNLNGFHVPLNLDGQLKKLTFDLNLVLGGSDSFYVAPVGRHSSIRMESDWKDPSFQGNWLPSERSVNEKGFEALWEIPYLGRNYPQGWLYSEKEQEQQEKMRASAVGVDLVFPLDTYGKTERSLKYELIFIGLTFLGFWLFEILSGIRIHPMQYLFVGGAICLFYLLLLSLAEHTGFMAAYFIAAAMVVSLVTAYARIMLRSNGRAALAGGAMTGLYLFLLTLLQEQEHSLLAGSIGLFVILAAVMYLTRNINWYSPAQDIPDQNEAPELE